MNVGITASGDNKQRRYWITGVEVPLSCDGLNKWLIDPLIESHVGERHGTCIDLTIDIASGVSVDEVDGLVAGYFNLDIHSIVS